MAENLESGRAGANLDRYHESIKREALRLRRLVDDVLDFSRLERGKRFEARIEDVDPTAWFDSVAAEAAAMAARPGAASSRTVNDGVGGVSRANTSDRDGDLAAVQGQVEFNSTRGDLPAQGSFDREALRRAVLNLVDNALRHSGSTEVGLHAEMSDQQTLVLRVMDRGKGIPARQRANVFDPFTRLNGSQAVPGAGLGLAIVREIALAHGGTVIARDPREGPGIVLEIAVPIGSNPGATETTK
jgi:signal transduction histidine kinase